MPTSDGVQLNPEVVAEQVARKYEQSDAEGELLRAGARDPHAQEWPGGGASAPLSTALDPVLYTLASANDAGGHSSSSCAAVVVSSIEAAPDAAEFPDVAGQTSAGQGIAAAGAPHDSGSSGRFGEASSEQSYSLTGACTVQVD